MVRRKRGVGVILGLISLRSYIPYFGHCNFVIMKMRPENIYDNFA